MQRAWAAIDRAGDSDRCPVQILDTGHRRKEQRDHKKNSCFHR